MRVRLRPANVIWGSFDCQTGDCVLPLKVDFICAEGSSGSCEAVVVKLEGGSCEPSRCVHEVILRRHLQVDVLYILFANFRRQRCFDSRSFFWGTILLFYCVIDDGGEDCFIWPLVRHGAATDLFFVDAIL